VLVCWRGTCWPSRCCTSRPDAYGVGITDRAVVCSVLAPAGWLVLTALAAFGPASAGRRAVGHQASRPGRCPSSGLAVIWHTGSAERCA